MKTMHEAMRQSGRGRWLGGAMLAATLLLSGCVTGGYPGQSGSPDQRGYPHQGSYPGDPGYPGGHGNERLIGSVQDLDLNAGRLRLSADTRGDGGVSPVEVYFDRNTQLVYQGRVHAIGGLERGDRISVDAVQSQGRLWARQIEVVQNVRDTPGISYHGGELRGAVSDVDPRNRLITITRGGYRGSREQVRYDERTQVDRRGQRFRPEQLAPGDLVRIQTRPWGDGWMAERISIEVDARPR